VSIGLEKKREKKVIYMSQKPKRKPKHPEILRKYWREAQRRHRAKKKSQQQQA